MPYKINDEEIKILRGKPHIARLVYYEMRSVMDFETGVVGRYRRISERFFIESLEVESSNGIQGSKPTRGQIRAALKTLEKIGLIEPLGGYCFLLKIATRDDQARNKLSQISTRSEPEKKHDISFEFNDIQCTENNISARTEPDLNPPPVIPEEPVYKHKKHYRPKQLDSPDGERLFQEFWNLYPRKEAKKKTLLAWKSKKLAKQWDEIRADLESREWPDNAQFIMLPTTYLNGERWKDSVAQRAEEDAAEQEMMERLSKKLEGKKWD